MSGLIGPLKWTSSNTNVATVNSSGKVSAKKSGNTTVTVSVGNLSASCNVTVKRENTAASYEEKYKNYLAKMDSSYSFAIVNSAEGYIMQRLIFLRLENIRKKKRTKTETDVKR